MTAHAPTPLRPKAARPKPRAKARRKGNTLPDLVREAVDEGATTVEEIHKSIAALPFDVLERLDGFDALEDLRRAQKRSIGAVYDVIRKVNHEVTRLADELLATARKRAKPMRARATKRS